MNINPINSNKNFGLIQYKQTVYHPNKKIISNTAYLQNGKSVRVDRTYDKFGNLIEKFSCVRNELGEWMRLKVKSFKDGKVVNIFKGEKCL